MRNTSSRKQVGGRAFTLIELLVVLAILAILATLLVVAGGEAIYRARNAVIAMEVGQLSLALQQFHNEHSVERFPPDGSSGADSIESYLANIFPRRDASGDPAKGIDINTGARIDADLADIGPEEALHFWLSGFAAGPHPLSAAQGRNTLFGFDPQRLTDEDNDGWLEYAPQYCQGRPYVYFAAEIYDAASYAHHNAGVARAYRSDVPLTQFAAENKFQIITAGQDGDYGSSGSFPSGNGYSGADDDNLTSFSNGTLGDERP